MGAPCPIYRNQMMISLKRMGSGVWIFMGYLVLPHPRHMSLRRLSTSNPESGNQMPPLILFLSVRKPFKVSDQSSHLVCTLRSNLLGQRPDKTMLMMLHQFLLHPAGRAARNGDPSTPDPTAPLTTKTSYPCNNNNNNKGLNRRSSDVAGRKNRTEATEVRVVLEVEVEVAMERANNTC